MNTETHIELYSVTFRRLPGEAPVFVADVDPAVWTDVAQSVRAEGGLLVSIWGKQKDEDADRYVISAAYCLKDKLIWLQLETNEAAGYPDLSSIFRSAVRIQRGLFDLLGVPARGAEDTRQWLNHGRWPRNYFPLRQQNTGMEDFDGQSEFYPFVTVEGAGVHEIAVGPIHAGIIEPGHFRFSIVGEKVLRLEQFLGYTHKGIDKLFTRQSVLDGYRLAGRVSGDSTVAYSWAYSMAAEAAMSCRIPARAQWIRALLLERERVANHLGDLGAMGNDGGFAFGLSQFMILKEDWFRLNRQLFGHRMMMDCIIPGGTRTDIDEHGIQAILEQCDRVEKVYKEMRWIYDEHAGLQDRFVTLGIIRPELAQELGLLGMAARASSQPWDARVQHASPDSAYSSLNVRMALQEKLGDAAARVNLRMDEIDESLRLIRKIVREMPAGPTQVHLANAYSSRSGAGWVEGWRGPIFVALESDENGNIVSCHCHDPSWQNWPALEHAIIGDIVPDFPLINKSFNLTYSGQDR